MSNFYVGNQPESVVSPDYPRFFYALRREEDGTLWFTQVDTLIDTSSTQINRPGASEDDYNDFETGVDFFDGRDGDTHVRLYPNLYFDEYRWDQRAINYFIDANGEFIAYINQGIEYNTEDNKTLEEFSVITEYKMVVGRRDPDTHPDGQFFLISNGSRIRAPIFTLERGAKYTFTQNDNFNVAFGGVIHPLIIATEAEGANDSRYEFGISYKLDGQKVTYAEYTNPTLFAAAQDRRVDIVVAAETPDTLYYYNPLRSGEGNQINVVG